MDVLVTGAAGFLGTAVCQTLRELGHDVLGTDRAAPTDADGAFVVADLLDPAAAVRLCAGKSVVVHLANWPHVRSAPPLQVFSDNVSMNMNLFVAAADAGVRQIIFASSIQTFVGNGRIAQETERPSTLPYLPLDSRMPRQPGNLYALSKCVGEDQLAYMVAQAAVPSGVALRFPALMNAGTAPPAPDLPVHPQSQLDLAFTWLSRQDAGRLIGAILVANLPGYHCYFPAAAMPRLSIDVEELVRRYFRTVPLRGDRPLRSTVDLTQVTAETGWAPRDAFPAYRSSSQLKTDGGPR